MDDLITGESQNPIDVTPKVEPRPGFGAPPVRDEYGSAHCSANPYASTSYNEFSSSDIETGALATYEATRGQISYPMGVVGAMLGACPGLFLWIVLMQIGLGWVASFSGVLIAAGSLYGYKKFSGSDMAFDDKLGVIICLVITALFIYLGVRLGVIAQIKNELDNVMNSFHFSLDDRKKFLKIFGLKSTSYLEINSNFSKVLHPTYWGMQLYDASPHYMLTLGIGYVFGGFGAYLVFKGSGKFR